MRTDDADAGSVKVAQATCHREAGPMALAAAVRGAVDACGLEAAVLVPVLLLERQICTHGCSLGTYGCSLSGMGLQAGRVAQRGGLRPRAAVCIGREYKAGDARLWRGLTGALC